MALINELLDLAKLETPDVEAFVARRMTASAPAPISTPLPDKAIVLPPATEIAALRDQAQREDIKSLLILAERLEQGNPDYRPFLNQLRTLA